MTDKMREAFEKWYMTNTFAHVAHLSVFYNDLNCYSTPIANHCWKAWQAAQSMPVVGEADCYNAGLLSDFGGGNVEWWQDYIRAELARAHEFYVSQMPTHSITAAELERLKRCRELLKEARDDVEETLHLMRAAYRDSPRNKTRLDKQCEFLRQIDAAIAAEGEKK